MVWKNSLKKCKIGGNLLRNAFRGTAKNQKSSGGRRAAFWGFKKKKEREPYKGKADAGRWGAENLIKGNLLSRKGRGKGLC